MLMTTLPAEAMPARQIIALYGLRWQIELAFKRLKSLIGLADLAAEEPPGQSRPVRQADPRGALREPGRPRPRPFPFSPSRPSGG